MTEQERSKLLFEVEKMLLRKKSNVQKNLDLKYEYGVAATAVRQDNTFLLDRIDKELGVGFCCCGRPVDICDEPVYCKYCGQRTSGKFGWTINNYWGEK